MKYSLDAGAFAPNKAHEIDAGYDLRTPNDFDLYDKDHAVIFTGIHIEIPIGYVGMIKSKSGLNVKYGITTEGVIDAGYSGQLVVKLYRNDPNRDKVTFKRGDKIAQLVVMPIYEGPLEEVKEIEGGERGINGFGSTGR